MNRDQEHLSMEYERSSGNIPIDEFHFPDINFRRFIVENCEHHTAYIGDELCQILTPDDVAKIEKMDLSQQDISVATAMREYLSTSYEKSSGNIPIDEFHFPDVNFRRFIVDNCEHHSAYIGDEPCQILTPGDVAKIEKMDCSQQNIRDFTGIENFSALKELKRMEKEKKNHNHNRGQRR